MNDKADVIGADKLKNGMRPIHPGEILMEEFIRPSGKSIAEIAISLDVPYCSLIGIINGDRNITPDFALRLEHCFENEAQGWINLQSTYDLRISEISNDEVELDVNKVACGNEKSCD